MSVTVCDVDANNVLCGNPPYSYQSLSKGFRHVTAPLPAIPAGSTAQWTTTLSQSADADFGEPGTGTWEVVADNRKTTMYLTTDGSTYTIGSEASGQSYDGLGPVPAWLTTTARPSPFYTWENGKWVLNVAADTADAQTTQTALMEQAYATAVSQNVSFTNAGGVTKTFQADSDSQDILNKTLNVCKNQGSVPSGFWWKSSDNTHVSFTLADLVGLSSAMFEQGWTAFQTLDARKASIMAATTRAQVQAVSW